MQGSLYVLLDANVIIEAHARGVWASLVQRVRLVVPATVRQEAEFFIAPDTGEQVRIDLLPALQSGVIREVSASAEQLDRFRARFDRVFIERMDAGEAEALALLLDEALPEHRFCTGDGPAIRALSLIDRPDAGISLEKLLQSVGLWRKLLRPYTEGFFQAMLAQGAEERIRGVGLGHPPKSPGSGKGKKRGQ